MTSSASLTPHPLESTIEQHYQFALQGSCCYTLEGPALTCYRCRMSSCDA